MTNLFKNNAYYILGLDVSSEQKEIIKRTKEIINRLKIDDCPEYDIDIPSSVKYRTEELVKTALQNLQSPKKKIKEYFFWYQLVNEVDENAFKALKNSDYSMAIQIWDEASKTNNSTSFFYKKNLAILYCMLLDEEDNETYLRNSILLWKDVISSEKFWEIFFKSYDLSDDQSTGAEFLNEFKNSVPSYLSDIYTELHSKHQTPIYINEFQRIFSLKSEKMEKSVLSPIYESINNNIENIEKLEVNKDGVLNQSGIHNVKSLIQLIQDDFNKLIDLGLYDDSQTKILRDKTVESIREIVLELHNNLSSSEKAEALLNVALQIVGTSGLEEKINQDIRIIKQIQENAIIIKPIYDLINSQKHEEAYVLIEKGIMSNPNHYLLENYINSKKDCIYKISGDKWLKAIKHKNYKLSAPLYIESGKLVYENINLFDINKKTIDDIILEIKKISENNIGQLQEYRDKCIKNASEAFSGKQEEHLFQFIIDWKVYGETVHIVSSTIKKQKIRKLLSWLTQIAVWGGLIAIFSYFHS